MKNIFATVKVAVTTRQAAEHYGLKISRNGMTCCPFHDDKHPSMKVDERYYCFGCHETGDVIDFTAKLFSLTAYEAAKKLAYDFHIDPNSPAPAAVSPSGRQSARPPDNETHCIRVLTNYERMLKRNKERYAPEISDEVWDERFKKACDALPAIGYYLDSLYSRDPDERKEMAEELIHDRTIRRLEDELCNNSEEVNTHGESPCRAA